MIVAVLGANGFLGKFILRHLKSGGSSPQIFDCVCLENQEILPAQALKNGRQAGLHDLTPFLSDEELAEEMIVSIK